MIRYLYFLIRIVFLHLRTMYNSLNKIFSVIYDFHVIISQLEFVLRAPLNMSTTLQISAMGVSRESFISVKFSNFLFLTDFFKFFLSSSLFLLSFYSFLVLGFLISFLKSFVFVIQVIYNFYPTKRMPMASLYLIVLIHVYALFLVN